MKKLLGILAVLALLAVPAVAGTAANSTVTINVASYCGIVVAPGGLTMAVTSPEVGATASEGQHQATTTFKAQGNVPFNVVLTANETTGAVQVTQGMEGGIGDPYPTARMDADNAIGYGVALSKTSGTPAADGWTPADLNCHLTFPVGLSDGQIKINSYLDSGRSTIIGYDGHLAVPGTYTGTLTVTVSVAS